MKVAKQIFLFTQVIVLLQCPGAFAESVANAPIKTNTSTAAMQSANCVDFINETPQRVTCGFIDLPVDHDNPAKGTVTLPILIAGQTQSMSATRSDKAILIPGGGGPGGSIGFGLAYQPDEYLGMYANLRAAGFDLIILDQRGAGLSRPILRCPETVTEFQNSVEENQSFKDSMNSYRSSIDACRTRLESRIPNLEDFDTYQSARDFLAVIQSLPYSWWATLATSYATVIAQEMELLEPSTFDRIVLDSPVAIDYQRPFTFELTESSLQRILSLCEITRRCNKRHSDIKNKFQQVLSRVKEKPVSLEFHTYESGNGTRQINMQINDATLLDILITAAYSNYSIAEIPWIIDGLHKGKFRRLTTLAADYWHYNSDLDYASALSWVIHCKERVPMEEAYLRRHPTSYGNYSENSKMAYEQERMICKDWNIAPAPKKTTNGIIATQTLIVAGDLDPVINRDDIENTADNFTNKEIMILPGTGHSVWFQSECTRQNTTTFFANESKAALQDCRDGISRFK